MFPRCVPTVGGGRVKESKREGRRKILVLAVIAHSHRPQGAHKPPSGQKADRNSVPSVRPGEPSCHSTTAEAGQEGVKLLKQCILTALTVAFFI